MAQKRAIKKLVFFLGDYFLDSDTAEYLSR
jgi:hypothetical protein